MNKRILGRTGFAVSEVGFGAWAIGGNRYGNSYGPTDDAESRRAIRRALDVGCTFFDTADVYGHGHSEEVLGEALGGERSKVVIATKVGGNFYNRDVHALLHDRIAQMMGRPYGEIPADATLPVTHDSTFTPEYIRFALEQSLRRLGTDYVDLLQLHNPALSLIGAMDTYGVLEDLKQEGKIRAYGVSIHPPEEGMAAIQATMPDTIQVVYNIARRDPEDGLLAAARAANVGIIAREPLANGFLAGAYGPEATWEAGDIRARMPRPYVAKMAALGARVRELAHQSRVSPAQLALRFVLDNPDVGVVIVGVKNVKQVDDNFALEQ
ncbi:MAG TPA: aldo/keto reductase [Gemmatimonadales bacterium]|nr:aldo/keto reductase [Gemmatimonadales bacterium]